MNTLALLPNPVTRKPLRCIAEDGSLLLEGADFARALGYRNPWAIIAKLSAGSVVKKEVCDLANREVTSPAKKGVCDLAKRGITSRARKTQEMSFLTEQGVYELLGKSRGEVAARFRQWLYEEVLPTIHRFGFYDPALVGADKARILRAVNARCRALAAAFLAEDTAGYAASGLVTVRDFRGRHGIAARDGFAFARQVQFQAGRAGVQPQRFFLQRRGLLLAWPLALLLTALVNFQPRLALGWTPPTTPTA